MPTAWFEPETLYAETRRCVITGPPRLIFSLLIYHLLGWCPHCVAKEALGARRRCTLLYLSRCRSYHTPPLSYTTSHPQLDTYFCWWVTGTVMISSSGAMFRRHAMMMAWGILSGMCDGLRITCSALLMAWRIALGMCDVILGGWLIVQTFYVVFIL